MTTADPYLVIGERIQQARLQAGLHQEELAAQLGYRSAATISHFETGTRKVSVIDLQRIAQILDVPIDYFFGLDTQHPEPVSKIEFRTNGLLPDMESALQPFIKFVEGRATKPQTFFGPLELDKTGEVGRIALRYLQQCEIDQPPVDPRVVARKIGVPVFDWALPEAVSGLTVFFGECVCIGVNSQHPNVRQRFSMAHEIGHVVLHKTDAQNSQREAFVGIELNDMEAGKLWNIEAYAAEYERERQANWFAADLLMPKYLLELDHESGRRDLANLARRYDVSQQALYIQLKSLKLSAFR